MLLPIDGTIYIHLKIMDMVINTTSVDSIGGL